MTADRPAVFRQDLLRGRVALVTGGGTGICRGIALAFAAHGAHVVITSRRPEHLDPTAREIEAAGVRSLALPADVRDPAAVAHAVAAVHSTAATPSATQAAGHPVVPDTKPGTSKADTPMPRPTPP